MSTYFAWLYSAQINRTQEPADNTCQMDLLRAAEKWKPALFVSVGFVLIVVIGAGDYLTGYGLSFSLFYFLPLAIISWKGGKWLGLVGALVCTFVWFVANKAAGQEFSSLFAMYWNTSMRFLTLAIFSILLWLLTNAIVRLDASSRTDPLTGAANSREFLELLKREIVRARRYKRPITLAYIDLDNFKGVNDTYGHATGDKVLQTVVSTVNTNIRVTDILARLGGDEFALLLPEADVQAARTVVDKIRSGIAREMASQKWPVTLSVGLHTSLDAHLGPDELIRKADDLMYEAKVKGKDTTRFSSIP
jgi:diguanylate cyclase (GGDEF)-like protein